MFKTLRKIFGVSEMPEVANQSTEPAKFIKAGNIPASLQGSYEPWRVDADGVQWLKLSEDQPEIQAIALAEEQPDEDGNQLDELEYQEHLTQLMFRKHKLRARERAEENGIEESDEDE